MKFVYICEFRDVGASYTVKLLCLNNIVKIFEYANFRIAIKRANPKYKRVDVDIYLR